VKSHQVEPPLRWPGKGAPMSLNIYRQKDGIDEEFLADGQL
jgi:hypothetical protein